MKKIICAVTAVFVICAAGMVFAQEKPEEFGNKKCPVLGEKIKEDEAVKYEYNGVVYNLCCKMCARDFAKDPEKYIAVLQKEKEKEAE